MRKLILAVIVLAVLGVTARFIVWYTKNASRRLMRARHARRLWRCIETSSTWDTSEFAPGDYLLRVVAADYSGNEAVENRDVLVTVTR